ncbi:hypothetical protein EDD30_5021 [Couchioplanes caeruleus]|uniref:Uncharacterized protein n=1 Tax=Couchioplanes caeruleus TaxID=56438 RepID=A0A3N1GPE6_9ACTN|nr:hypothetical protein EDD30_5021 [Couchioplanes caeruleus]
MRPRPAPGAARTPARTRIQARTGPLSGPGPLPAAGSRLRGRLLDRAGATPGQAGDAAAKSISAVSTVPAVRPGALWYFQ